MTWAKHGWASLAALVAFSVLTLVGGGFGIPSLIAIGILAAVMSVLYWHYRRRRARGDAVQAAVPVVPGSKDDRVIPNEVKNIVALRDKGVCQIKGPPCIGGGTVWDHKVPYSWGGSSKDPGNIQQACEPCNSWKSDHFADTDAGRITYEEWERATRAA